MKTSKFQADLAQSDFAALQSLMSQMDVRSKADFLSKAIYFFQMAIAERKRGNQIAFLSPDGSNQIVLMPELERVAPKHLDLTSAALEWTEEEINNFRKAVAKPQPQPTTHLVRAMKNG